MLTTTGSAGSPAIAPTTDLAAAAQVRDATLRLCDWLKANDYNGYDPFDGLSARFVRPFTFETKLLRTVLQQGVRRFPLNLRPLLGVRRSRSTKGMGFIAWGYFHLHDATGDRAWQDKAESCLAWLMEHQSPGYSGACWGNHFDYQSRIVFAEKGLPSIVWTSLIGHAFLDRYDHTKRDTYLRVVDSSCQHILRDFDQHKDGDTVCLGYFPKRDMQVHNASTFGASLLIRTAAATGNAEYRQVAERALAYTAKYQRPDGSWYYGEGSDLHWVDNFHTGYVLDCFKRYSDCAGARFEATIDKGYEFWKRTFFLEDGTPRYYDHKTYPLDIQCASQAIDTLVYYADRDPQALALATKVASWTIEHMQDRSGYFYYRRYPWEIVNKTATLHWGQATMLAALGGLYRALQAEDGRA